MIQEFAPQNPSSPQSMRQRRLMTLDSLRSSSSRQPTATAPAARQTQPRQRMTAARDQLAAAARPIPSPQPEQPSQFPRPNMPSDVSNLVSQAQAGNADAEAKLRAMGRDAAGTLIGSGFGQQKKRRLVAMKDGKWVNEMGEQTTVEAGQDENVIQVDLGSTPYGRMLMQREAAQRQDALWSGSIVQPKRRR